VISLIHNLLELVGIPVDITDLLITIIAIVCAGTGTYLLLPHRHGQATPRRRHVQGGALAAVGFLLFALYWSAPGPLLTGLFFIVFCVAALVGAVLTVTARNPVYSALWFASVILSTSGLFLIAGAQFLAAGTVIVYAGAIIVTFLFVIMLAQMEGRATYDRAARAPGRATITCFLLFWAIFYSMISMHVIEHRQPGTEPLLSANERLLVRNRRIVTGYHLMPREPATHIVLSSVRPTAMLAGSGAPAQPHVAGLGGTLFTDHLITVGLAGALLFVALIAALSIAAPQPPIRPGERTAPAATDA
jgi:NADH-quinone oxidoreductase subunit J